MDILKTGVERYLWGLLKHKLKKTFSSNYVQDIYFRELKKTGPNILSRSGGKNMIFFWRKIVIFHTEYPKIFRASLRNMNKI
jgi:hypothetical protein